MARTNEQELIRKLDLVARLMAINLSAGKKNSESIPLLAKAGFSAPEIADLLDTTANTVRVAIHYSKKKSNSRKEIEDATST